MVMKRQTLIPALALILSACSNAPIQPPGDNHLSAEKVGAGRTAAAIPAPVQQTLALPKPKPAAKVETYSVVVNNVRVQELLFALARDAKLNVDIHPGIEGAVTLNAIDQTLQQLLTRIAKQVDVRWELDGPNLIVMPDAPFLRTYKVDYVNMSRDVSGTVAINTQIASTSTGTSTGTSGSTAGSSGNNSSTKVTSKSQNNFWESLHTSLVGILNEKDRTKWQVKCEEEAKERRQANGNASSSRTRQATSSGPTTSTQGSGDDTTQGGFNSDASSDASKACGQYVEKTEIIVNADAGVVVVRATSRQHEHVREYLDQVLANSHRQVLIEATIAEVSLDDKYQQGIEWSRVGSGFLAATGLSLTQATGTVTGSLFTIGAKKTTSSGGIFSATLKLLETFGNVKVLSSPKISVLNNQTAMLKVVDNIVYFTIKAEQQSTAVGTIPLPPVITATPNSVAVGMVMSVTPQISNSGTVLLNVRPTITRVTSTDRTQWAKDPTPNLGTDSYVPEIQTREMESMLRLTDGEIAVMGGLMSDELSNSTNAVPVLSMLPGIGTLFTSRNDLKRKTELVILLRPIIIRDPSIAGDYREYAGQLPDKGFFEKNYTGPRQQQLDLGGAQ